MSRERLLQFALLDPQCRAHPVERAGVPLGGRQFQSLALFHLTDQKPGRHGGVGLQRDIDAVQLEEVLGPQYRVLEHPVGFVDARCPLHRSAALGIAGVCEAVRMDFRLDLAIGALEPFRIERITRLEAEQLKMILHDPMQRTVTRLRHRIPWSAGRARFVQSARR